MSVAARALVGIEARSLRLAVVVAVVVVAVACKGTAAPAASTGSGASQAAAGSSASSGAAGGGSAGGQVAAGGDLCGLLGAGDFTAAGITGAGGPKENNNPPDAYYCVYRGDSSATGGIEFDAFLSSTSAEAHTGFPDMFAEYVTTNDPAVTVAGADEAALHLPTFEGSKDPAIIEARKGKLTFGIGVGTAFVDAQKAGQQLQQLAALVVQRAGSLGN